MNNASATKQPVALQRKDDSSPSNVVDLKALRAQNVRKDGDLINERYRVVCKLDETAISTVYLAEDQRLGRKVVLKHLHKTDPDMSFTDLLREAQVLSMLNHPNILTVYDSTADDKGAYIITEYVQGETIEKFSERRPLDPDLFVKVVTQMMEGLAEAHHHGIIHGDIKPNNIMVVMLPGNKVQVKILDFGLANLLNDMGKTARIGNNMLGSAFFMAPEQFENKPTTVQSDIYSLGCVCYHALTGKYPFNGEGTLQIMAAHLQHMLHDISTLRPDLPATLSQWVMWMINLRPETRPGSIGEATNILNQCFQPQPEPVLPQVQTAPLPSQQPATPAAVPTNTTGWQNSLTQTQAHALQTKGTWPYVRMHAQRSFAKLVSKQQAVMFMNKVLKKHGYTNDSQIPKDMHRTLIAEYFAYVPNRAKQKTLIDEMEVHY